MPYSTFAVDIENVRQGGYAITGIFYTVLPCDTQV